MLRRICLSVLTLYVVFIAFSVGHVLFAAQHGCKQKGDTPHKCRHVSSDGKQHKDESHDGNGHIQQAATRWDIALRQVKHSAFFGFQDDASVPPDCICMTRCFFSGDGLPSPNYPN